MAKKKPIIKFDKHGREVPPRPDSSADRDSATPITHARYGTAKSTLVSDDVATVSALTHRRPNSNKVEAFDQKVRHLLKNGRT